MPRWEYCDRCGNAYNPNVYTAEERLVQAIFGEHLCPKCLRQTHATYCDACTEEVLAPVYYEDVPYHSKCLAEMLEQ